MNHEIQLMAESGLRQLRLVVYPIICKVLIIPGGDRRNSEPSTVLIGFIVQILQEIR